MRHKFNLDIQPLEGFTIMPHGDRASGKTHLIGDMLLEESKAGKVKYINIEGEDGMRTIAGLGLGDIAETITEFDDLLAIITECAAGKYQALGLDSFPAFAKLVMKKVTGGERLPVIPSRDQLNMGMQNEWPEVHRLMESVAVKLRKAARYVMVVSTSDKSANLLDLADRPKLSLIAPNLPGKEANESNGWFDYVGYLDLKVVRPGQFARTFNMVPDGVTKVRQRVRRLITTPISIPDGRGGWLAIKTKIEEACAPAKT